MRLLAYKPFWLDQRSMTLHPYYLPDYTWPSLQVVTSPCPLHKKPVPDCVCGMHSILSHAFAREFLKGAVDVTAARFPILGVVQVLGPTIATPCTGGYTLRSWGQFMWGLVQPPTMKWAQARAILDHSDENWQELNPVWYEMFAGEVIDDIDDYAIKFRKELPDLFAKGDH